MVNVGQMMVWVIGANLQFEIFHFLAAAAAFAVCVHAHGQNSNFPWNPQFLADFKNLILFSTQNEKLGRMELVPSRSERKSWSVKIAHTLFSPRRHASWLKKRRRSAATHFYENIFF